MSVTYLASAADLILKVIKSYDIEPDDLFRSAKIDPETVMQAGCRISYRSIQKLWELMIKEVADPCMGLRAAEFWHPSHMNALGYAWLASSTLDEAMDRLARYIHIVTETIELGIEHKNGETHLKVYYNPSIPEIPQRADLRLTTILTMCRINYGNDLNPLKVLFRHASPVCSAEYSDLFRAPVHFGQQCNCLTFNAAETGKRLSGSNPYIAEINDKVAIEYLSNLGKTDILQRTKKIIVEKLPSGNVTNEMVANKLYMSVRSFQRALQGAGVTYRSLLADTRRELAENYIRNPEVELQEVAFQLGFTEYSAFSRAFKQWTGKSPVQMRSLGGQEMTVQ